MVLEAASLNSVCCVSHHSCGSSPILEIRTSLVPLLQHQNLLYARKAAHLCGLPTVISWKPHCPVDFIPYGLFAHYHPLYHGCSYEFIDEFFVTGVMTAALYQTASTSLQIRSLSLKLHTWVLDVLVFRISVSLDISVCCSYQRKFFLT